MERAKRRENAQKSHTYTYASLRGGLIHQQLGFVRGVDLLMRGVDLLMGVFDPDLDLLMGCFLLML